MGKELRSLPRTETLYRAITDVYRGLLVGMETERERNERGVLTDMLFELWTGRVKEDIHALCALGHKRRRLQRLGEKEEHGEYSFPTYVSHLLELEDIDFIRRYRKKYWLPLEQMYLDSRAAWYARSNSSAGHSEPAPDCRLTDILKNAKKRQQQHEECPLNLAAILVKSPAF